jgi:hypothetical protein
MILMRLTVGVGQEWYPDHAISWYKVDDEFLAISYTEHNKFGMKAGATVWKQYLASFYWVAATITSSGLSRRLIETFIGMCQLE